MTTPEEAFEAFVVRRAGDGDVTAGVEMLRLDDLPEGDVVVAVEWSGVNYKDGMVTVPGNRVARTSPLVPGVDLAGRILQSHVPELPVGLAVLAHGHDIGVARHGGFSACARVPAEWVLPLPDGLSARHAMAIGTAGFTAALSVDELERHGLRPGDGPVLVTGAAGGVGSLSVELLAGRGHHVVASTGRADAEGTWLRDLGAAEVIGRDAIDDAPGRVLGGERWAGAVDCVGGETLARILRSLRYGGAVAASGLTGGNDVHTTVYPFITRQVALLGIDSVQTDRSRRSAVWKRLAGDLRPRHLDELVEQEVDLNGLPAVLERILRGKVRGRVLVSPGAAPSSA
ncbi:MAG TPA: acryloyl-CoA reductase [Acidimicrobiales bacterium]|nr:acryloyl-CoA reductase [Acidimicrobiales bacterium]